MSVTTEPPSSMEKPSLKIRPVLIPAGNGSRVSVESKRKKEGAPAKQKKPTDTLISVDSSCSSDSASEISQRSSRRRKVKPSQKLAPVGFGINALSPSVPVSVSVRRCDWITANSDALYVSFHDQEWGVAVKNNRKLFELFILSQMLSEFSWQGILNRREEFRKLFDGFNLHSISMFTNKDLKLFCSNKNSLVSETKLKTIIENAIHMVKIQEEFGSFGNYCWSFVNHKPIQSGFRYGRQVPMKTAKAEAMSRDMMKRGFRCVGATVLYSFMQASGIVNDHVTSCFRYRELVQTEGEIRGSEIEGKCGMIEKEMEKNC